jgi:hypothetical protein
MGELKVYLFDPPRVEMDKAPVDIQRRKALALLVYLTTTGQPLVMTVSNEASS